MSFVTDFKTILAPTDFSSGSRYAARYAVSLAGKYGAELVLLHVYEMPAGLHPDTPVPTTEGRRVPVREYLRDAAQRQLEPEVEALRAAGVPVHPQIAEGRVHDAIVKAAADLEADLIVISTHGRTGLSRVLLGSTAEQVIRRAPCPVFVVREPAPPP